jgi:hypothetical protein
MSLSIDTEKLVAVYAFGEWHEIQRGTVDIDAYELMHYLSHCNDDRGDAIDYYEMGSLYEGKEPAFRSYWMNERDDKRMHTMKTPAGCTGFCFITPQGTCKAFSLMECKGFEYEAI